MTRQATAYIVTDIEADGPVPGRHSMLSFASAAIDGEGADLGRFTINLRPVDGATTDPGTMGWWATQAEAWGAATRDPVEPEAAIAAFVAWVRGLPGRPVFAAHPLSFDGLWIDWYVERFAGLPLFDRPRQDGLTAGRGLDLPTLVMAVFGWDYHRCHRRHYPEAWLGGHAHSHRALDDALGYAHLLKLLLAEIAGRR